MAEYPATSKRDFMMMILGYPAKDVAAWAGAVFGLVAAALWFWSTITYAVYKPVVVDGWTAGAVLEERPDGTLIDPFASLRLQGQWNQWAALATGLASLCQAASLYLSS